MATYNLGRFILNPRGSYSSSATYSKLDVVLYQGSSYICKADSTTAKTPTNTTYWQLLAQAGQATMTEQQKQEIISGILAQGVVVDPNYNTYTSEEKQKLSTLSVPQDGTLTVNYGSTRLGTFSANESTNIAVNIPTPKNAGITLVRQDDPNVILGKFTLNQEQDDTIQIPCGGSGSITIPNINVFQGSTNIGTVNLNQGTAQTITIPNNILTIQKNGTTVGTYTPATAATINVTVPTSVNDLSDGSSYAPLRGYTSDRDSTTSDVLDDSCSIDKLLSNYVYYCSNATGLRIDNYYYDTTDELHSLTEPVTYIYVECVSDFTIDLSNLPNYELIDNGNRLHLTNGNKYLITVIGHVFRVDVLS